MLIRLATDPTLACEHGILRASDAQAVLRTHEARAEAQERCAALERDARARAEAIVAQAQSQAAAIVEQARQQAQSQVQAGTQQALELVEQARASIEVSGREAREEAEREGARRWHERHEELAARGAQMLADINERLAGVVVTAVERVIAAESRSALFERALKTVHSLMRGATAMTLRLHPDDQPAAQEALAAVQAQGPGVELLPDATLQSGTCLFESELGVLDASLSVQLEGLRLALTRAAAAAGGDAAAQAWEGAESEAARADRLAAEGLLVGATDGDYAPANAHRSAEDYDGEDEHMPFVDEDEDYDDHDHEHDDGYAEHDGAELEHPQ